MKIAANGAIRYSSIAVAVAFHFIVVNSAAVGQTGAKQISTSLPSTAPTSGPTTAAADAKLPDAFAIFQTVNPFSSRTRANAVAGTGPEAATILNGTAQSDAGWTAFLQDLQTKAVVMLSIGDSVARGRLTAIDLDSVQYEAAGTTTRVQLGQNLQGQTVAPSPPASQPADANSPQKQQPPPQPAPDPQANPQVPPQLQNQPVN